MEGGPANYDANKSRRRYFGTKRIVAIGTLSVFIAMGWYLYDQGIIRPAAIEELVLDNPVKSILIFIVIYVMSAMATLPTLPLNLAAGLFWGGIAGGVIATLGSGLGAVLSFSVVRIFFNQPLAARFDNRLVKWLQRELDQKGWQFIAFIRVNPVFPTAPLNYILALTSVRWSTYTWASLVFLLPPSVCFALIGEQAGSYLVEGRTADTVRTVLLVSAAITALVAIRECARYLNARSSQ